jgi:hypothetical protein
LLSTILENIEKYWKILKNTEKYYSQENKCRNLAQKQGSPATPSPSLSGSQMTISESPFGQNRLYHQILNLRRNTKNK